MEKNQIKITEIFKSLSGEGNPVGAPTTYIRFFGCNMKPICPWCIEKNTLIDTTNGKKKAKDISKKDILITPFGETNIKKIMKRTVNRYVKLKLENGKEIKCSLDHPFIDENGNEIKAKKITNNTKIMAVK